MVEEEKEEENWVNVNCNSKPKMLIKVVKSGIDFFCCFKIYLHLQNLHIYQNN